MTDQQLFDRWMAQVDREIQRRCGLGSADLADWAYRDSFNDELSPAEVAVDVLQDNGFAYADADMEL